MDRKLSAILAADVVGYSALMERDEAGTHERLKAGRKELFEPEIARHHGRVFKLMGDGLLAEFGSVVDAVECAVALQRGLAERNAAVPEDQRVEVRIGINLGEVIVEGEDRYGEGVNIAARLEQLAEPGGIWVSAKVAREVEKKLAFGFEAMGEQKVKNIAEPVAAFRVKLNGAAAGSPAVPAAPRSRTRLVAAGLAAVALIVLAGIYGFFGPWNAGAPLLPDSPSIAVLPFENLSDDPQQAYFADGIAEDVTTDLSRVSGLFVIARNSSFAYRGKATDVRQIARELGVRYVLEGSVRRAGDALRINVQLVDGETGAHRWAERYEGGSADIFALQDKVTKAVVAALALQLSPSEQSALSAQETGLPSAYDAFLQGWNLYQRTTPENYKKAIPYFERAIELDPDYGRAHAALAMVYFRSVDERWSGLLGVLNSVAERKANDHLKLAMKRPTSTAHQLAGNIARNRGWYDEALKELQAAIALDPSDSWSHADLAYTSIWAGRAAEAERQIAEAMRIDPRHPPVFEFYRGLALFAQDRLSEATAVFEETIRSNPEQLWARLYLAATFAKLERKQDAAAALAAFNATRVNQGGLPFLMREIQADSAPLFNKFPERTRLADGLRRLAIPWNFNAREFDPLRLTESEMDSLIFGHRLRGRSFEFGDEHGATVSADGASAIATGLWGEGSGSARLQRGQLCFIWSTTEKCGHVLRNPGGTRAKENEYIWFIDGWGNPFSQVR
jgi:TolB-like protein/class 3 adenylate cyclase/lipoprotein NlpI